MLAALVHTALGLLIDAGHDGVRQHAGLLQRAGQK